MLAAGYAPYRAVFISQPPAWLKLIRWSFALFGQNMRAGQMLTVSTLVLTALAVGIHRAGKGFLARSRAGLRNHLDVAAGFLLGPRDHRRTAVRGLCRRVAGDGGAIRVGRQASVARGGSIGSRRCIVGQTVWPLCPSIRVADSGWAMGTRRVSCDKKIWYTAADILLVLGITFAAVLTVASLYGVREVWTQAVAFHLGSRADLQPGPKLGLDSSDPGSGPRAVQRSAACPMCCS